MRIFNALVFLSFLCIIRASAHPSIEELIPQDLFEEMLKHRGTSPCEGAFYTYDAFIAAANQFKEFGETGDLETRKREIAAFFAQTSHETTGGWEGAPDGRYTWGYCWVSEQHSLDTKYYGRGPFQLAYEYNYAQAGKDLGIDLVGNPDLVAKDPYVSFLTAFWFWTKQQPPKPSCHDVISGNWVPTPKDVELNRWPGYGLTTNVINGGLECGLGYVPESGKDRIGFYRRYCDLLGVGLGPYLDCSHMRPFDWSTYITTPAIKNATHHVQSE